MMLTSIEIDGKAYHARREWDNELKQYKGDAEPILDEDGDLISLERCLCNAYSPTECFCDTTSWENYRYEYE